MALREIDESELLSQQAVVRTVNAMLANKDARKLLLQARKAADPNAVIPEIDAAAPVQSELAEMRRYMEEDRAQRAAEKAEREQAAKLGEFQRDWNKQKSKLRKDGWGDEGIDEIEKHAQERGIFDLEVAAAHWEKLHPPAEPVQPNGSGSWGFFDAKTRDDTFVKSMFDSGCEDEGALDAEISAALKDFRSQTGARR